MRLTQTQFLTLFTAFAALSIACNLAAQFVANTLMRWIPQPNELLSWMLSGVGLLLEPDTLRIWFALGFGTLVGLVVKYLLDSKYIFAADTSGLAEHGKKFSLYTLMGVATTVIFWGVQMGFEAYFDSEAMMYLGGLIGLSIGYTVKYQLDSRFVFRDSRGELTEGDHAA